MSLNDAVDWRPSWAAARASRSSRPARSAPTPGRCCGPVPRSLWERLVADELDPDSTLTPGAQLPAGRDARRAGAGRDGHRRPPGRRHPDPARRGRAVDRARPRGRPASTASTVDVVALSHLHFDHAGGLLDASGAAAFPRARIVAQRPEWEFALGSNLRLQASYEQDELRLVSRLGLAGRGRRRRRRCCPASRSSAPAATRAATRRSSCGARSGTVAFFGDLCMRPWSANPRWVTRVRRLPAHERRGQGHALPPGGRGGLDRRPVARAAPSGRPPPPRPRPHPLRGAGLGSR